MKKSLLTVIVAIFIIINSYNAKKNTALASEIDDAEKDAKNKIEEEKSNNKSDEKSINSLFYWYSENEETIGLIKAKNIETALIASDQKEDLLLKGCGINPFLSNENHITITGHNCERSKGTLNGKLFTNVKYLQVGESVLLETIYGNYKLVVTDTNFVSVDDYKKDNYKVLLNGDVSFATCEWNDKGEKGRRVVYMDVVDVNF